MNTTPKTELQQAAAALGRAGGKVKGKSKARPATASKAAIARWNKWRASKATETAGQGKAIE